jgi:hypothetical protein
MTRSSLTGDLDVNDGIGARRGGPVGGFVPFLGCGQTCLNFVSLTTSCGTRPTSACERRVRTTCARRTAALGKPANGVESKYLLTGMATCGQCGGGMLVYSRSHGKKRAFFYGCPRARVGLCRNDLEAPMPIADTAALAMMNEDVLAPDVIERALKKLMAKFAEPAEDVAATRKRLTGAP